MKELKHKHTKLDDTDIPEWLDLIGKGQDMVQVIDSIIKNYKEESDEAEIAELRSLSNHIGDVLDDLSYLTRKRNSGKGLKWRSV